MLGAQPLGLSVIRMQISNRGYEDFGTRHHRRSDILVRLGRLFPAGSSHLDRLRLDHEAAMVCAMGRTGLQAC